MKSIRTLDKYQLIHDPKQNLWRVSDGIDFSDWFELQTRNELMALPNYKFTKKCDKLIDKRLVS